MTNRTNIRLGVVAAITLAIGACDLDVTNPNSPTEEAVITDLNGVVALGVGIQGQFAQTIDDYVVPSALVTDEWGTRTRSLLSYQSLFTGQSFEDTYDVVSTPYGNTYQIVKSANTLLASAPNVGMGPALQAGTTALAKLFKGMTLGMAAQLYEELPVNIATNGAVPLPRAEVMDSAIALFESARDDIADVSDADLAGFRSRILGPGIDLRNTIEAMIARYALFRGDYEKALDAAANVDLTVLSQLTYPSPTVNPVYNLAFGLQYVGGTTNFVESAEPGDQRPSYWLQTGEAPVAGNPGDSLSYTLQRYSGQNDAFALYLPDEIRLIMAEAQARLGQLPAAIGLINDVRTQTASALDEPVAGLDELTSADLPDVDAVLRQIAYERRYELYTQGLRWEDTRRLPGQTATTMAFMPLPATECRNNPNAANACN